MAVPARPDTFASDLEPAAATSIPPTPGPTNTPIPDGCDRAPIRGFGKVWGENASAREYVGCPTEAREKAMDFIAQRFEGGVIFHLTGAEYPIWAQDHAYALFNDDGTFIEVPVIWGTEQPTPVPPPTAIPTAPFEPQGNLAEIWRDAPGVKDRLGLAIEPEKRGQGAFKEFSRGWMYWIPYKQGTADDVPGLPPEQRDRWIYVLASNWPQPPGGERSEWLQFLDTFED